MGEIKVKQDIYLIGLFYSPSSADSVFFNSFNANIEKASEFSNNLILVGDLNEDLLIKHELPEFERHFVN